MTNIQKITKERVCGNCKQPFRGETLCPHISNIQKIIEEYQTFVATNDLFMRGYPVGKLEKFILSSLTQIHQETMDEIANKFVEIEKEKWKDAEHCTCLGFAIVSVFGEKYEEILRVYKKREHKLK